MATQSKKRIDPEKVALISTPARNQAEPLERYMTVIEAANFLCLKEATIRYYLTKKILTRYKINGTGRTVIKLSDAQRLISVSA